MAGFVLKRPTLRAWLETRKRAWADRLLPQTHRDAWRGSQHFQRGVRGYLPSDLPSAPYFVLKRARTRLAGMTAVYALVLRWRQRWCVMIPLSAGGFSHRLPPRPQGSAGAPSVLTDGRVAGIMENTTLASKLFAMDFQIFLLWQSLLRGLGGVSRLKLRYKGKSFKWHRRKGALLLRFGHSHLVALSPLPGVRWRRFGRMKIVLYGSNWWDLADFAQTICWWRPVNVYHGRGIRLRRQTILRKSGKVSAYR